MTYAHLQGLHSLREFYSKEKCENLKNDNFDPELILWLSNKIMKSTKWALADINFTLFFSFKIFRSQNRKLCHKCSQHFQFFELPNTYEALASS